MCVTRLPDCSAIPLGAVISEGAAVYVSALQGKNKFRSSATAAFDLFFIIIDHRGIGETKAL